MHSDHVPGPLVPMPELLVTVVAPEPVHLVNVLVFQEELLCLETPPAVPHSAEVGISEVHFAMILDALVVDSLESAQYTRVLVTVVAMPFVGRKGARLEIFPEMLTSDHFVDLVMTLQSFLVRTCIAAAITPGPIIITVAGLTFTS